LQRDYYQKIEKRENEQKERRKKKGRPCEARKPMIAPRIWGRPQKSKKMSGGTRQDKNVGVGAGGSKKNRREEVLILRKRILGREKKFPRVLRKNSDIR